MEVGQDDGWRSEVHAERRGVQRRHELWVCGNVVAVEHTRGVMTSRGATAWLVGATRDDADLHEANLSAGWVRVRISSRPGRARACGDRRTWRRARGGRPAGRR